MKLEISGQWVDFRPSYLIIAGFTGRDQASVRQHIEELAKEGVSSPDQIPVFFFLDPSRLTIQDTISVYGSKTSGEVEPVLVHYRDEFHLGVGSDHTDRQLEATSMAKSKAICPKVMSSRTWRFSDVNDRWDRLILRSWVGEASTLYQEGMLEELLPPDDILARLTEQHRFDYGDDGVLFLGTIPLLTENIHYDSPFRGQLLDPEHDAELSFSYDVRNREQIPLKEGGPNGET